MPIDYTKLLTPEQQAQLANVAFGTPIPERQTQSPKLSAPMQVGVNEKESFVGTPVPVINGGTVPQEQRVENVRQRALEGARQGVASATETRNSLLQQMFDARRQDLEKERTDSTRMALYNSFGNLLRTMVQPIGWAGGRATAGVQPYDERQYLDAYNRAVRASDDIRNLGFQENQLRLNYADRDVQNAERRLNINEMRDEKMLDNYLGIGTGAGRGKNIHEDRKTEAVRAWTIHNNGMTLSQYIRTIQGHFPDFFGEWNPNEEELKKIEEDVKKNKPAGKGKGSGSRESADLGTTVGGNGSNGRTTAQL